MRTKRIPAGMDFVKKERNDEFDALKMVPHWPNITSKLLEDLLMYTENNAQLYSDFCLTRIEKWFVKHCCSNFSARLSQKCARKASYSRSKALLKVTDPRKAPSTSTSFHT